MSEIAKRQFVRQQGFEEATAASCVYQYPALMFQPRLMVPLVLIAFVSQSAAVCLALAGVLWWNVLAPTRNPFDALYNAAVASPQKLPPLPTAPAPRRLAQLLAGSFFAGIGLALLAGSPTIAWILEGMLLVALGALVLGRFCLGSYLYYLLRGQTAFANRTLPWSRAE
jgi:hypothetical protein